MLIICSAYSTALVRGEKIKKLFKEEAHQRARSIGRFCADAAFSCAALENSPKVRKLHQVPQPPRHVPLSAAPPWEQAGSRRRPRLERERETERERERERERQKNKSGEAESGEKETDEEETREWMPTKVYTVSQGCSDWINSAATEGGEER